MRWMNLVLQRISRYRYKQLLALASFFFLPLMPVFAFSSASELPPSTMLAQQRGQALFHTKGCEHCHGADASGGRGPDLRNVANRMTKQQIRRQILDGGKSMPGFRGVLKPSEVQDLIVLMEFERTTKK